MSIIKGLFIGLKNLKVIPFNEMTPEIHDTLGSNLAKVMMVAKMSDAKLTKAQREYVVNQAKQLQEFEDRYITGVKDKSGNVIKSDKGIKDTKSAKIFNLQGEKLDPSKPITGGTQQGKTINREFFERDAAAKEVQKRIDSGVAATVEKMLAMEPIDAMKEANRVIKREGPYKNLSEQDAKKILQDTEDHIFERNIKPKETDMDFDDNDFAVGGRVGFKKGNGVADEEAENARFAKRVRELMDEGFDMGEAVREAMKEGYADGGMLVQPSMTGKRPGYRGDAAAKSSGAAASGRVGGSDVGESSTRSDPRDDGPDDRGNRQQNRNQRNIVNRSTQPKESILKKLYDTGQELSYFKNLATGNFPGLTKQLLFDLGKRKLLDPAANTLFPEGDLQEIKMNAPDQRTYNIEATKDMVGNLPGGLLKDIVAPAGALVMSPFYDAGQAITRMEPGSGLSGFMKAFDAENPLSSAAERFTGASAALAERLGVANGGRIGFKKGMDRRTFMKIMAGLTTLPVVGKFFKGAEVAAPVAEKAVKAAKGVPPYFFDLVNKIKAFGEPRRTPSYRERVVEYQYTGKNGIEYELVEELDTGNIKITKDKIGGANYGDESFEVIEDRTEMNFVKGQGDEATRGKPADEYEEYKVEFDQDGTVADASEIDEVSKMEIIKEVTDETPSIKKAGGGIARMLGE